MVYMQSRAVISKYLHIDNFVYISSIYLSALCPGSMPMHYALLIIIK